MSAASPGWDAANAAFLAQAFGWLHGQLAALPTASPGGGQGPSDAPPEPDWSVDGERLPGLLLLRQRFGLSVFETKILLLCAAAELDAAIGPLCGRAQADGAPPHPSFALGLRLFADPDWAALSPHQPLRAWRLVECATRTSMLVTARLRTDERIVHFLTGLNEMDERLGAALLSLPADDTRPCELVASQRQAACDLLQLWRHPGQHLPVLTGADHPSKVMVAHEAARSAGLMLCRSAADLLPGTAAEADLFELLWRREQILLPLALLIETDDLELAEKWSESGARRLISRLDGPVALACRDLPRLGRPMRAIAVGKPKRAEQAALWRAAFEQENPEPGRDEAAFAASLAGHFSLPAPAILALASQGDPASEAGRAALWRACRDSLRPGLDKLAQRIDARAAWSDLVLPADRAEQLAQIVSQVRHRRRIHEDWGFEARSGRGLGISALFAGESGTGKTLAAEVLAASLGLDLYRIDLSGVVSKYIGETEKNLRLLFDAAEESGAILFFDEADALFGKRSEVRDSHDRYANIEVNYLLQRIEAYRGLAILATNLRSSLDSAFLRRLRFVVNFPYPGPAERQVIWQRAFPPAARMGGLDWAQLGRLNLTGGNIATVALNAAFLASADDSAVEMRHVLAAARAEYVKLDRPFRESDFLAPVGRDKTDRLPHERVA